MFKARTWPHDLAYSIPDLLGFKGIVLPHDDAVQSVGVVHVDCIHLMFLCRCSSSRKVMTEDLLGSHLVRPPVRLVTSVQAVNSVQQKAETYL